MYYIYGILKNGIKEWVNMTKKWTIVRVERDVLERMKQVMPHMSNPDRIRITFNTSLVRFESALQGKQQNVIKKKKR